MITGVSSLPALSSAVVDRYLEAFSRLDSIRIGISSGALVPGIATVRAVFSYCGQPIRVFENGQWIDVPGWLDRRTHEFPRPVGQRLFGACDVPDLALLPRRYPGLKTMNFHAGFASDTGHKLVEVLARQVQAGRLESAQPFARLFYWVAQRVQPLLSDSGGMYVKLEGLDTDGEPQQLTWTLLASENHGPHVPCGPAIALTHKIAAGFVPPAGAQACMGLLSVEEILGALKGLGSGRSCRSADVDPAHRRGRHLGGLVRRIAAVAGLIGARCVSESPPRRSHPRVTALPAFKQARQQRIVNQEGSWSSYNLLIATSARSIYRDRLALI